MVETTLKDLRPSYSLKNLIEVTDLYFKFFCWILFILCKYVMGIVLFHLCDYYVLVFLKQVFMRGNVTKELNLIYRNTHCHQTFLLFGL